MIITRVQGGFGNQLFQYAMARAVSLSANRRLFFDAGAYRRQDPSQTPRRYQLYEARPHGLRIPGFVSDLYLNHGEMARRGSLRLPILGQMYILYEDAWPRLAELLATGQPLYLCGYWQSERFFEGAADRIRSELRASLPLSTALGARFADLATAGPVVSMHVRRTDLVTNPTANAYHGTVEKDWYETAMALMRERLGICQFLVFSDDLAYCRSAFGGRPDVHFHEPVPKESDVWDLRLMADCRHHIIANSSFSWWGAWLNDRPDKIVIAPDRWIASGPVPGLIPPSWISL